MRAFGAYVCLLVAIAAGAEAQPLPPADRAMLTAAPSADTQDGQRPSDLLRVAQTALAAGRKREALEVLEKAQTRLLDRSVPLGQTNSPSDNLAVGQIAQARLALSTGDKGAATEFIQSAIASATAQGL